MGRKEVMSTSNRGNNSVQRSGVEDGAVQRMRKWGGPCIGTTLIGLKQGNDMIRSTFEKEHISYWVQKNGLGGVKRGDWEIILLLQPLQKTCL